MSAPIKDSLTLDREPRPARKVGLFLLCAALLVTGTGLLTVQLTAGAVEDRIEYELAQTARLLGGGGFPLTEQALLKVSDYVGAEIVATDAAGQVIASSLETDSSALFESALEAGAFPAPAAQARVIEGELAGEQLTVGVAPIPTAEGGSSLGAVYVLYPEDQISQASRRAWLPVALVAVMGVLLAVFVGRASERASQRARTQALLRLLVSVAHEIRNPLGAIRSLAQSLKRRLGQGVDPQPLELIASEADRLSLLVDGLRTVGLPVRTLHREILPDVAVGEVLTLLGHQLSHRRTQVLSQLAAPRTRILADPAQVRQVVLNLVLNAVDAMPSGGQLRLVSSCEQGSGASHWVLRVKDSGPGVPLQLRARLFTPFFTTKDSGVGIGLYMSRRILQAHGGSLELDPAEEGGCFVIRWPALSVESADRQEVAESTPPRRGKPS